jgi:hypothetical protein
MSDHYILADARDNIIAIRDCASIAGDSLLANKKHSAVR